MGPTFYPPDTEILVDETDAVVTPRVFGSLYEYSASLPTGTTVGKRWRRRSSGEWWLGEYIDDPDPDHVGIRWRRLHVLADA